MQYIIPCDKVLIEEDIVLLEKLPNIAVTLTVQLVPGAIVAWLVVLIPVVVMMSIFESHKR